MIFLDYKAQKPSYSSEYYKHFIFCAFKRLSFAFYVRFRRNCCQRSSENFRSKSENEISADCEPLSRFFKLGSLRHRAALPYGFSFVSLNDYHPAKGAGL